MNIKEKLASTAKKERSPQQQKAMTILNWVATAVCIVVIVFALIVAIFMIAGTTTDKEYRITRFGDKIYLNVATDSMEPTFNTSDVLIANAFDQSKVEELKVGQVITFKTTAGLYKILNTHRIIGVYRDKNGEISSFRTRGDNQEGSWQDAVAALEKSGGVINDENRAIIGSTETVSATSIVATWGSVDEAGNFTAGKALKGVGSFSNWIQDVGKDSKGVMHHGENMKTRFFCVVVLPLILLFVIYAFILVRTLVIAKLENQRKVQSEQVVSVDGLSDEEKRRLALELLASLQASAPAAPQTPATSEEKPETEAKEDSVAEDTQAQETKDEEKKSE